MNEGIARVEKPWGYELHWAKTERYVGKLIHVNAGHALSLQYHNLKDETIYLHSGKLLFEIQDGETLVKREMLPGERVHITPKTIHRMPPLFGPPLPPSSVMVITVFGAWSRSASQLPGARISSANTAACANAEMTAIR